MQDLSSADSVSTLIEELGKEFGSAVDRTVIASYVGAAVRELTGSICPEALPEMACRLAGYRLTELTAEPRPGGPSRPTLATTTTYPKGGVR